MNKEKNVIWPGWEVGKTLGWGSYATVYEIRRDNFGVEEKAALKVISLPQDSSDIEELRSNNYDDASITARFQSYLEEIVREYSTMAQLKGHPNVVYCDDLRYIQRSDGFGWDIYIKMELLTPLTNALNDRIAEEQVVKLGKDIANALAMCGQLNILHRDIKPQNIFVGRDGSYKLGDFGVAKTTEKTSSGTQIGTPPYMAPEVYKGEPYDHRADVYSLGLVMYWMLNRRRLPFLPLPPQVPSASEETEAKARRFRGEALPFPAEGSRRLKEIVLKACAYDPQDRYASADELYQELDSLDARTEGMFRGWQEREEERRRKEEEEARRRREEAERKRQEQEALRRAREEEERKQQEQERLRLEQELKKKQEEERRRKRARLLIGIFLILAAAVTLGGLLLNGQETQDKQLPTDPTLATMILEPPEPPSQATTAPTQATATPTEAPDSDGWLEKGGELYYYWNGAPLVGWYNVDGQDLYFQSDGRLARNISLSIDGARYTFGSGGQVNQIEYAYVDGYWADDRFTFGDTSGTAVITSYKELSTPIENCTSLQFQTEISDDGGYSLAGEWTICLRINGHWQRIDTFHLSDTGGFAVLYFDEPITFDAYTAYRTQGVKATYYCNHSLSSVTTKVG